MIIKKKKKRKAKDNVRKKKYSNKIPKQYNKWKLLMKNNDDLLDALWFFMK